MNVKQNAQQGFTLIELMIVIAIVGILAAIALPAYQDYLVRSRMSEPLAALAEAKTSVAEYLAAQNKLPQNATEAGIKTQHPSKPFVASMSYTGASGNPTIIVSTTFAPTYDPAALPSSESVSSNKFFLQGLVNGTDNEIQWVCYQGSMKANYLPATCRN
jgi:type IV pilus assembly protein PilA